MLYDCIYIKNLHFLALSLKSKRNASLFLHINMNIIPSIMSRKMREREREREGEGGGSYADMRVGSNPKHTQQMLS